MSAIWTPEDENRSRQRAESQIETFIRTRPAELKRALLSGELAYDHRTGGLRLVPAKDADDLRRRHAIAAGHERDVALTPEEEQELSELVRQLDLEYLTRGVV